MNEKTITLSQLFFLIIQAQIGIAFLALPFQAEKYAKGNSWISVIVASIMIQLFMIIIWGLMKRHKGKTILDITSELCGKIVGNFINFLYLLFGIAVMSDVTILFSDLIQRWILEMTPKSVTSLLILSASLYLGKQNLRVIARFFTLVNVIILLLFILSFFAFTNKLSFTNLLPLNQSGPRDIFVGAYHLTFAMLGFEILLFIFPFVIGNDKQVLKKIIWSNLTILVIYLYFSILALATFSPKEIEIVPEPVLYMLKGLSFRIVERIDMIFLTFWIFPMMTTLVTYFYIASLTAAKLFHKGKRKHPVWYLSVIAFGISFFIIDEKQIQTYSKYVSIIGYVFVFVIPLILLILSMIVKKIKNRSLPS
ncbi:GerAB/ArcD/ProY family transporter [Pseudoneobacillus sp. C159]